MNSIIVSETCTAPQVPIHVPFSSRTWLSHPTPTPSPSHTHPLSRPPLLQQTAPTLQSLFPTNPWKIKSLCCALLLYSPWRWARGSRCSFPGLRRDEEGQCHCQLRRGSGPPYFWTGSRQPVPSGQKGVEFGRGSFSLSRNTMEPRILKRNDPSPPPFPLFLRQTLLS